MRWKRQFLQYCCYFCSFHLHIQTKAVRLQVSEWHKRVILDGRY